MLMVRMVLQRDQEVKKGITMQVQKNAVTKGEAEFREPLVVSTVKNGL